MSNDIELGVHCATKAEVDQHLQMGMQLIAKGQYSDALSHFHSAIGKNVYQNQNWGYVLGK